MSIAVSKGALNLVVTQKRIAELLGVDRTTVTKALSDSPDISENLKVRVKTLCNELGYRHNYHSRVLRTRETKVISVLKGGMALSYLHSQWLDRLSYWAHEVGYTIRLESIDDIDTILAEQSADGFVSFHGPFDRPHLQTVAGEATKPIIFTDCSATECRSNCVVVDNAGGMAEAVKHLVEMGHRKVVFWGLIAGSGVALDRHRGYLKQLNNMDLSMSDEFTIEFPRWPEEPEETFCHKSRLLALVESGATAVVSTSDVGAVGAIKSLNSSGIETPDAVAVTGFDDSLVARVSEPTLTSVRQDVSAAAKAAVDMLMAVLASRESQPNVVVPSQLVVRESTTRKGA